MCRSQEGRGGFEGFGEPGGVVEHGDALLHPTFLKLKKWLGAGNMEEVALLVAGLDLEVEGWRRMWGYGGSSVPVWGVGQEEQGEMGT